MADQKKTPKLAITQAKTRELEPSERTLKTYTDDEIASHVAHVQHYGNIEPLRVWKGKVLDGDAWLAAAERMQLTTVPVIDMSHFSEPDAIGYSLAIKRLAEAGEWDWAKVIEVWDDLEGTDFPDLDLTGFDLHERETIKRRNLENSSEANNMPPLLIESTSETGDVWTLGDHRILCGDTNDLKSVTELLQDEHPQIIVTSPPYNQGIEQFKPSGMQKENPNWATKVGEKGYFDSMDESDYQDWQRQLLDQWFDLMEDGGALFYNHKPRYRDKSVVSPFHWLPGKFNMRQEIIWNRGGSITLNARMFMPCDERVYWLTKGKGFFFTDSAEVKSWSSVWSFGAAHNPDHPVAFPVELPSRAIVACSREKASVYDPFSGSGTTLIASEMLGRRCFAMEMNPLYVDLTIRRWEQFTDRKATHVATGKKFSEVEKDRQNKHKPTD